MSLNLIELVTKQLGSDTLGKLGSLAGIGSPDQTKSAVGAAVPTLLAGLASVASTGDGAQRLSDAVGKQDTGILGNFSSLLGGSGGSSLMQSGSGLLGSLLGNNMLGNLTGMLSRFTGLGQGATGNLLGALTPMLLGILGGQAKSGGLNASGLASLLAGQKQNIAAAMPAGLGNLLGAIPGLGGFADAAKSAVGSAATTATDAARYAADTAAGTARAATAHTAQAAASATRWIIPLVIAAVLAFLLFRWFGRRPTDTIQPATPSIGAAADSLTGEAARVSTDLRSAFETATTTLGGIRDAASADAALPRLGELNAKLGGLKSVWDGLPAAAKSALGPTVQSGTSRLRQLATPLLEMPVVGDKLRPVVDEMMRHLDALRA